MKNKILIHNQLQLKAQLKKESILGSQESMLVLQEFDSLTKYYPKDNKGLKCIPLYKCYM
jgi:hypothetical protein